MWNGVVPPNQWNMHVLSHPISIVYGKVWLQGKGGGKKKKKGGGDEKKKKGGSTRRR
jgi:hypothetical protein